MPAYFTAQQKEATVAAGTLAGLETVRLIRSAAAVPWQAMQLTLPHLHTCIIKAAVIFAESGPCRARGSPSSQPARQLWSAPV